MNYHNITHDDMNNGDGLRCVLWVAGCNHHCKDCQNPITWNPDDGLFFGTDAQVEIYREMCKPYISGLTLSGGDPFYPGNRIAICGLCRWIKEAFPDKTIWVYTGYTWEEITAKDFFPYPLTRYIDVLVDGVFIPELKDNTYHWAGSTNQRVIDVQKSIKEGSVVSYESH